MYSVNTTILFKTFFLPCLRKDSNDENNVPWLCYQKWGANKNVTVKLTGYNPTD